ncbi:prolipoprotein diacylglyceryl transferase [Candidatus Gracilibacteria bacterium]|nr:prolipoprotein diacylglyceryl transferase [Candidatus Gracilibacteria bacterium]
MQPLLFKTKFFSLHTFWIFFAIAFIAGTYTLIKLSIKHNLKVKFLSDNFWKLFIWSIIGARISAVILNYKVYFYELSLAPIFRILSIWDNQLNLWGGIIAFLISFYLLCKEKDQDFFKWLDAIVPSIIVGLSIGHIGAFFQGINYGHETSLPWGVNFESISIKYAVPIHPTQIYAFLYSTLIAAILITTKQFQKIRNMEIKGLIGISGITIYSLFRFLESFVRGEDAINFFNIRLDTILSFVLTISAGIFLYLRYNRPTKKKTNKSK